MIQLNLEWHEIGTISSLEASWLQHIPARAHINTIHITDHHQEISIKSLDTINVLFSVRCPNTRVPNPQYWSVAC